MRYGSFSFWDTHQTIQRLQSKGFEPIQAEALTEELKAVASSKQEGLANKEDIAKLEGCLKEDLAKLEGRLKEDIAEVRGDIKLLKWMLALVIVVEIIPYLKAFLG